MFDLLRPHATIVCVCVCLCVCVCIKLIVYWLVVHGPAVMGLDITTHDNSIRHHQLS